MILIRKRKGKRSYRSFPTKNIPILCLHLGGEERRGAQSDEFIKACLPAAKMVIVVKSGNKDGLFTGMCQELSIPLIEIDKTTEALGPLKNAFTN